MAASAVDGKGGDVLMTDTDEWLECEWDALNEQCLTLVDPKGISDLCWIHEQQRLEEDAADTATDMAREDW